MSLSHTNTVSAAKPLSPFADNPNNNLRQNVPAQSDDRGRVRQIPNQED